MLSEKEKILQPLVACLSTSHAIDRGMGGKKREGREAWLRTEEAKTMAQQADKHACYQLSVQDPKHEITNLRNIYLELSSKDYREPPKVLREDFCGTAILCDAWVSRDVERQAIGVDIDPEVT